MSDSLIALSYYSIPATLVYFIQKRRDLPFDWVFFLFGAFIVLCGTTHLMEIWTLWHPDYWVAGVLKAATALVSIATAGLLVQLVPKALAIPSPAQLETANQALAAEITERERAEQDLRVLNTELEQRVQERAQELLASNANLKVEVAERKRTEVKLRAYTARLEQSNRELQDFAYVASHDLQEPLRKIQTFGDRLQVKFGNLLTDQGRDYLERMQGAAKRMQTLIEDLLAFSRVTTKDQPFETVDLMETMQGVLSDLEARLQQGGGQVHVNALPTIEATPIQMRQLLQNLLSNGLKFHQPDVPPVISVSGMVLPDETGREAWCQIQVTDNGIGFEEKYVDRIFTMFQRLHGRKEYEGTGVGLAICRKIAERHGGTITATSAPGQGATFTITLPIHQIVFNDRSTDFAELSLA